MHTSYTYATAYYSICMMFLYYSIIIEANEFKVVNDQPDNAHTRCICVVNYDTILS